MADTGISRIVSFGRSSELASTGVVPGKYPLCTVEVGADGRIYAISAGAGMLTLDVTPFGGAELILTKEQIANVDKIRLVGTPSNPFTIRTPGEPFGVDSGIDVGDTFLIINETTQNGVFDTQDQNGFDHPFNASKATLSVIVTATTHFQEIGGAGGGGSGDAISIRGTSVDTTSPTLTGQVLAYDQVALKYLARKLSLDDIDPAFAITSFAKTGGNAVVEVGASIVTPAFTAAYAQGNPTTATLSDTEGGSQSVSGTPTSFSSSGTFSKTALAASVTWTLTAIRNGITKIATIVQQWGQKVYTGASSAATGYDETFIEALGASSIKTSRAGSYSYSYGAGNYAFFAVPAGMGTPVFSIGGFAQTLDLVASGVSVTNSFGVTFTYNVYRLGPPSTGAVSFTLVVS